MWLKWYYKVQYSVYTLSVAIFKDEEFTISSLYASNSGIYPVPEAMMKKTKKSQTRQNNNNNKKGQYFSSYIQDFQ